MLLLINMQGADDPGFRSFYAALRQRLRRPVLALTLADPRQATTWGLTVDRPLTVQAKHRAGVFCFVLDCLPLDLLLFGMRVICPAPPRAVVVGIEAATDTVLDGGLHTAIGMEAARRGLPALAIERRAVPDDDADDDGAAAYAADLAMALPWSELKGRLLELRLPAALDEATPPPRPFRPTPAEPDYAALEQRDTGTAWTYRGCSVRGQDDADGDDAPGFRLLDPLHGLLAEAAEELAQRHFRREGG